MRIAWFTPFSTKSAIGKYSRMVTDKLIKYCEVDLWLAENENLQETKVNIIFYNKNENLAEKLSNYDLLVYNMGNYMPFHRDIYEISQEYKGVIILHDYMMHHFFLGYYLEYKKNPMKYINEMELLYGVNGKIIAEDSVQGRCMPVWETDEIMRYPFFEKVIGGAYGVITHSNFLAEEVRQKYFGPVEPIYFPFQFDINIDNRMGKKELGIEKDKLLLLTVGHVNPNKRVDKVIEVLGENKDLAEKVIYAVIGPNNHKQTSKKIENLIGKYNLQNTVKILGFQNDDILYSYMNNTDIFINLRYPAMEGASWSLLEQLYFGKPAIVTDTGFYSELPDDCLVKVRPEKEKENIYEGLKKLVEDEKSRRKFGEKGKKFAIENFNDENYCKGFLNFSNKLISRKPIVSLIGKVANELAQMGVCEDMKTIDRIALKVNKMIESG